jgi:hypothetical protein
MAYRGRVCQHLMPTLYKDLRLPTPTTLAKLAPVMRTLVDCAGTFDQIDPDGCWTAADFVLWIDVEVRKSAELVAAR